MTQRNETLYINCYNRVLSFIVHTRRTKKEVRDRIVQYTSKVTDLDAESRAAIETHMLEQLFAEGLFNDERYAIDYVAQHLASSNPKSKLELSTFLYKKGVPRSFIEKALMAYSEAEEQRILQKIVTKKAHTDVRKLKQYLLRRGFSHDAIYAVLSHV